MKRKILFRFSLIMVVAILTIVLGAACFSGDKASAANEKVYLGAIPLGVSVKTEGVYVGDYVDVLTENGTICPAKVAGLQKGDQIISIGGKVVTSPLEIADIVAKSEGKEISLQFKRSGEEVIRTAKLTPALDHAHKQYKLGFMTRRDVAGIGTLTYVKQHSLRYGCLGHRIYDAKDPEVNYKKGSIYSASINGYVRGEKNRVGELKGVFTDKKPKGTVDKNTPYGVFGYIDKSVTENLTLIEVGSRGQIKHEKAYIYTTIKGEKPDKYAIEIVKTASQNSPAEKGMVIRVIDERLLSATGGIVQGMSGSPIIQNDKLIGAVSHVFTNDPTMGYGMYIDWMINN